MMNNALLIARREYRVRVRTWSFWLLTVLTPMVAAGGLYICLLTASATAGTAGTAGAAEASAGAAPILSGLQAALQDPMLQRLCTCVLTVVLSIAYGYSLLSNLLEDRCSGMEELVLRNTRKWEYLTGKTLGMLCIVLTQCLLWCPLGGGLLLSALPYIMLGYLVNALVAYLTSRWTSSQARGRQLMTLVIVLELLPLECNMLILQHPDSLLARMLTWFPLTTAGTLPLLQ